MIVLCPMQDRKCRQLHYPEYQFHISLYARKKYSFDQKLFSSSGNIIFTNFHGARAFAHQMNNVNNILKNPEKAIRAGVINAIGLIDEIFHYVLFQYREQCKPEIFRALIRHLNDGFSAAKLDACLLKFIEHFPPQSVYDGKTEPAAYLEGWTEDVQNREILIEELLILKISKF